MKRIILVISHLGAGSSSLCYCLSQSKIIEWVQDGIIYDDPVQSIESILSVKHKYSDLVGLYVNEVVYNYQISHKKVYDTCEFVYLIRNPKTAIKVLNPKDVSFAIDYYIFRLRRIYEMAKQTKGAIFVTWEDLIAQKGLRLIINRLKLPDNPKFIELKSDKQFLDLPKSMLREAEEAYELCIYRAKNKTQVTMC